MATTNTSAPNLPHQRRRHVVRTTTKTTNSNNKEATAYLRAPKHEGLLPADLLRDHGHEGDHGVEVAAAEKRPGLGDGAACRAAVDRVRVGSEEDGRQRRPLGQRHAHGAAHRDPAAQGEVVIDRAGRQDGALEDELEEERA